MHAASELFSWGMELLDFLSRQLAPKIAALSVRFIRISFYVFFLVSKRRGGNSTIGVHTLKKGGKIGYTIKNTKSVGCRIGTTAATLSRPVSF